MKQKDDYSQILEKVFSNVKSLQSGVLFTCIGLMAPENANEIRNHFSISPSASFYEDFQALAQTPSFQPVLKRIDPMNIRSLSLVGLAKKPMDWNPGLSVGVIVVLALVVIGLWNFLQSDNMGIFNRNYSNSKKVDRKPETQQGNNTEENSYLNSQGEDHQHQADLRLVIPCKRIEPSLQECLRSSKPLSSDQAATLVDASVYFLATELAGNSISSVNLSDGWRDFPEGSDLLVQLHILNGNDLIGVDLKRSLSRAIFAKETITIKEIGLLNDLNNLKEFHRA